MLPLQWQGIEDTIISLTLDFLSLATEPLKTSLKWQVLKSLLVLYATLWSACDWAVAASTGHLLLILPDQHKVIDVMDQCGVLWDVHMALISWHDIKTEGKAVYTTLRQTVNEYCCPSHVNMNCSQYSFPIGMEKNTLTKWLQTTYLRPY